MAYVTVAGKREGPIANEKQSLQPDSMLHQPTLFSTNAPNGSADSSQPPPPVPSRSTPVWLQRLELFLRVVVRLYLGLLVLVLPWTRIWDENRFFNLVPHLAVFATHGVVRGVVSGLGLLNLWIALSEAIHYRESGS